VTWIRFRGGLLRVRSASSRLLATLTSTARPVRTLAVTAMMTSSATVIAVMPAGRCRGDLLPAEPRREADENDLVVRNDRFLALGLEPTTLSSKLLDEIVGIAERYRDRADVTKIISRSVWHSGMEAAEDLHTQLSDRPSERRR
jgi:hypothetical protein